MSEIKINIFSQILALIDRNFSTMMSESTNLKYLMRETICIFFMQFSSSSSKSERQSTKKLFKYFVSLQGY